MYVIDAIRELQKQVEQNGDKIKLQVRNVAGDLDYAERVEVEQTCDKRKELYIAIEV